MGESDAKQAWNGGMVMFDDDNNPPYYKEEGEPSLQTPMAIPQGARAHTSLSSGSTDMVMTSVERGLFAPVCQAAFDGN